ncbi:MAG: serine protease, partial [Flavobacteriales bacterium]|nr:serine protease [Flavobacteriales bacterium]
MIKFRYFLLATLFIFSGLQLQAKEGMWIPTLLKVVEGDMQAMGLKLSAEDIYSINNSSLKDAVVHFGGGCTAELISDQGLLLTNHHCGYGQIQFHSSVENDYLTNGFWAMSHDQELVNPDLTATLIVRIEDVTAKVAVGTEKLEGEEAENARKENIKKLEKAAVEGTNYEAFIRPFNYGNSYYIIVTKTYKDVRLVGAPPSAVGKFGGDTDNWMWPRHTGDFSLFRIYANEQNEPAEYATTNVPYKPAHHFPVSMDGVEEGDFTMVFGFPGFTETYLTSYAVDYVMNKSNPMRIKMRETSLGIIDQAMLSS